MAEAVRPRKKVKKKTKPRLKNEDENLERNLLDDKAVVNEETLFPVSSTSLLEKVENDADKEDISEQDEYDKEKVESTEVCEDGKEEADITHQVEEHEKLDKEEDCKAELKGEENSVDYQEAEENKNLYRDNISDASSQRIKLKDDEIQTVDVPIESQVESILLPEVSSEDALYEEGELSHEQEQLTNIEDSSNAQDLLDEQEELSDEQTGILHDQEELSSDQRELSGDQKELSGEQNELSCDNIRLGYEKDSSEQQELLLDHNKPEQSEVNDTVPSQTDLVNSEENPPLYDVVEAENLSPAENCESKPTSLLEPSAPLLSFEVSENETFVESHQTPVLEAESERVAHPLNAEAAKTFERLASEDFEVLEPVLDSIESNQVLDPTAPDLLASTVTVNRNPSLYTEVVKRPWEREANFASLSKQRERRNRIFSEVLCEPMSKKDLEYYYFNRMLQDKEKATDDFIKISRVERHPFYELVYNYYKGRSNLLTVVADVETHQKKYKIQSGECWCYKQHEVPVKGTCVDKVPVKDTFKFQVAEFNTSLQKEMEHTLTRIRNLLHEKYALCAYTAQLSKLQIESYIYSLFKDNNILTQLQTSMPVTSFLGHVGHPGTNEQIANLKMCISILFSFQRRPVTDSEFMLSSRAWLERMVAALLRVASLEDHLFLLNHLIRCPPGIEKWAANFLQLALHPAASGDCSHDSWGSPLLDHFLNMLAVLLTPAKYREEFLVRMKVVSVADSASTDPLINWTLLDEDGEEDEIPADLPLNESDLVTLLAQFPFDELFQNVLVLPELGTGVRRPVDAKHIMRLIAFSTTLLQIFHEGLCTYNRSRYRQFVKRIGRLIRHTVQYVSDQWTDLKTYSEDIVEVYSPHNSIQMEQLSFTRLQVEMDELFFRAVQCIMSSPRLGTWQFLADMPYTCVSPTMIWRLYWYLHSSFMGYADRTHVKDGARPEDYEWWLADPTNKAAFYAKLQEMPVSEVIYLLTTFANMATSRSGEEKDFIRYVTREIYQLTYVNKQLQDSFSKTGRELMYAVTVTHPFTFSHLLAELESTMDLVGNMVLFILSHLALHLMLPTPQDFNLLRSWLLNHGPDTIQSQVARLVLARLNWGLNKEGDNLVLDLYLHRSTAVLLVEAYCKHFGDKPKGGLQGVWQWGLIKSMTYYVENFDFWVWDLMIKLRLHRQVQPHASVGTMEYQHQNDFNWTVPDVTTDTSLYPVHRGLQNQVPLACYAAVAMTSLGHKLDEFLTSGFDCLQVLQTTGYQRLCIPALALIIPMFLEEGHPDYLISNDRFVTIIKGILAADYHNARLTQKFLASVPGETTKLFVNMVTTLMQPKQNPAESMLGAGSAMHAGPTPTSMLEFWLSILIGQPGWNTDADHCHLIDQILKVAFCQIKEGINLAVDAIMNLYKTTKPEQKPQGFLQTVFSFASSGPALTSFLNNTNYKYTWLAFTILVAETRFIESRDVIKGVVHEMQRNVDMSPEVALKKACNKLRLDFTMTVRELPIYRWSQLALDTELDHPLLPLIYQKFFIYYLQRYISNSHMGQRTSLGQRYFRSLTDIAFLKKLKRHLRGLVDFHHSATMKTELGGSEDDTLTVSSVPSSPPPEEVMSELHSERTFQGAQAGGQETSEVELELGEAWERDFHQKLIRLFQTFSFWLEEPLLHDIALYLPSLPEQYEPDKLQLLFNSDQNLWTEYVNLDKISVGIVGQVQQWLGHVLPSYDDLCKRSGFLQEQTAAGTPPLRLLQLEDPLGPPPISDMKAPVPDTPVHLLTDYSALLEYLKPQLGRMLEFATSVSLRSSMHVGLDLTYVELLPSLYYQTENQCSVALPCNKGTYSSQQCKGPAVATVRYAESKMSDMIQRRLGENRAEYEQVTIASKAPPPPPICMAAVHMENTITCLIKLARTKTEAEKAALLQTGIALFYHMAHQMNEDSKHYPPTRQFITSCIEVLGQDFIQPSSEQAQPLLKEILENPNLAGILAPNFCPNQCLSSFVNMYMQVVMVTKEDAKDMAFMLLTKFDIPRWLRDTQPDASICKEIIQLIGDALFSCGMESERAQSLSHFEVYRSHLQMLLLHNFPDHLADVLKILLKGVEEKSVHVQVWLDTLKTLDCPVLDFKHSVQRQEILLLQEKQTMLSLSQIREVMEWLGNYFKHSKEQNPASLQFGLYHQWQVYLGPLVSLLGHLALGFTIQETQRILQTGTNFEQALRNMWSLLCTLFMPWIKSSEAPVADGGGTQLLPAWSEGDAVPAASMLNIFCECIQHAHSHLAGHLPMMSPGLMNLVWNLYINDLARKGTRGDILGTYHSTLMRLPWEDFWPDLANLEKMVQVFEEKPPECLVFLGGLFPRISWLEIVSSYCQHNDAGSLRCANKFLSYLLSLLLIFANELSVTESQGRNLMTLFEEAETYPWSYLDVSSFDCASQWLLERSEPVCVFQPKSYNMRLMRAVAGMSEKSPPEDYTMKKQQSHTIMMVGLLCKASQRSEVRQKDYVPPVQQMLKDAEIMGTRGGVEKEINPEMISLLSQIISLLNNCSPKFGVPEVVLTAIISWLKSCRNSSFALLMLASSCRTLASTAFMAKINEACLESHFRSEYFTTPGDHSFGWTHVVASLQVPELSHQEFVDACIQKSCILTLFAYVNQQLPQCRTIDDEYELCSKLVTWTAECKLNKTNEFKILLWWHKIAELSLRLLDFGIPQWKLVHILNNLVAAIAFLGEDRSSSGFLGAIGFGKQSDLSFKFRLTARCISAFILAQITHNGSLRLQVNETGSVCDPSQAATYPNITKASASAKDVMKSLDSAIQSKSYASLKAYAQGTRQIILDSNKCLRDAPWFISRLTSDLFMEFKCLQVVNLRS